MIHVTMWIVDILLMLISAGLWVMGWIILALAAIGASIWVVFYLRRKRRQ